MLAMVCAALPLRGQEGVWTGKLEVSGTELAEFTGEYKYE